MRAVDSVKGETGDAMPTMDEVLAADVDVLTRAGLLRQLRTVEGRMGAHVLLDGRELLDFSSNDYLGLASDPRIAAAASAFLSGSHVGAAAARLVSGNHSLHMELERAIADFKGTDAALLFSSGYAANTGCIPALAGKRDVIYADELNHASLIDACRLSRAELRVIGHCDTEALAAALHNDRGRYRRRLLVVDAVFSMDGDHYPLKTMVGLAREHGAWTYVDDAHGTGVLGTNGRGSLEEWGVEGEVEVLMGTLGKAIGVSGAFIAGSRTLVEYLTNRARSFVYTTGTPPALAAATLEALRITRDEGWRREKLRSNVVLLREGLGALGYAAAGTGGAAPGHIIPVVLGDAALTVRIGAALRDEGFLVGAIRPPTVPLGQARLRITVSAAHEPDQISGLLAALRRVFSAAGVAVS